MKNSLFVEIKETVILWIKERDLTFTNKNIIIQTITDDEECLYVTLSFKESMAAIVVAESDFAPYRFVSFETITIENGIHKMVHSWYDEDGTSTEEIIYNLDKAIDIVLDYESSRCS